MKKEIWKEIEGFEGLYQISNWGRVKSLGRWIDRKSKGKCWKEERILKPIPTEKDSYVRVNLCKDKKKKLYSIHRLVAQAFIPNPNNLPQVNHKDENKQNNCISNLEWCIRLQNIRHSKVLESVKREVNQYDSEHNLIKTWYSMSEAARTLKVAPQSIFRAIQKHGKSVGYYWCYA